MKKVLFIFGTRPEAVKLCPIIWHLRRRSQEFSTRVCVTAQHRELLDQVLKPFDVRPDHDLHVMTPGQNLFQITSRIITGLQPVLEAESPDMVVVQGDTTTTFCGALASFYSGIPVAHVEAGLRTGDIYQPFPEEMNRLLTTRLSGLHLAATEWAAGNLRREGVPEAHIAVTGNTGIDAVLHVKRGLEAGRLAASDWPWLDPGRKLLVVTAHRRENFGEGIANICSALARLAQRGDVQIAYAVHPNPNVTEPVRKELGSFPNISLLPPQGYVPFVDLMRRAYLLITDSGGIQEEGPSLGKPILVLRNKTERPEAVDAGTVQLVGTNPNRIFDAATTVLDDREKWAAMARVHNPYGDGLASERIADSILRFHK